MLQWCMSVGDGVSLSCFGCNRRRELAEGGWSCVGAESAASVHVDMVLWCLDHGWQYTDTIMESAAREGRSHVIHALRKRGYYDSAA